MKYDLLFIGAGLFSSVIAYEATKMGKKCLIIDKRPHIGGNIYTVNQSDINVHVYGAHIFHTSSRKIWEYMHQFTEFNSFVNNPIANFNGRLYNLPFNMNTFNRIWPDVVTPEQAKSKIDEQTVSMKGTVPENLEEQAISLVGEDIYKILIKGYTEKQWGRPCTELPPSIIKRIPLRYKFDNNYFDDIYQGIPIGGYTQIIKKMLDGSDVQLSVNYFDNKDYFDSCADATIYTGMIDELYDYRFGELEYRSLRFKTEIENISNFQGNAVVNYTDFSTPYTRIIEHKHFEKGNQDKTIITYEYSNAWKIGDEPYYPLNDDKNAALYQKYASLVADQKKIIVGGRLGMYKYFDMDDTIEAALSTVQQIM